jgi:cyclohexanecarboxylate-CoA ligase/acyl-CoA synthetase
LSELNFAELRARANALAASLCAAGVNRGDRVVMQLPNWVEGAVAYHAVARLGAVMVPVIMVYRHAELRRILSNSGAVAVVTAGRFRSFDHAQMFRELRAECPALQQLVVVRGDAVGGELGYEAASAVANGANTLPPVDVDPDAPHVIVYTSGTESTSKGCVHTWNTFNFSARGLANNIFEMKAADCMFMPSPIGHATGLMQGIVVPLTVGAEAHLLDVWEPAEGLRRIEAFGCTACASATPFVRMALDAAKSGCHDLSSMRTWVCAGSPIPASLASEFAGVFERGHLVALYGCSEINVTTSCRPGDPPERLANTAGQTALEGIELKLLCSDGSIAAVDEEGEILYRGPGAMLGYWCDPQRSAAAIDADGWYHSGDQAVADAQGYYSISGRLKDIIIRGGENKGYLLDHPKVHNVAVVPYPDERMGERACAVVVANPGPVPTLDELVTFLRNDKRISPLKLPERLIVVAELPMTATGKVQKFVLRQMLKEAS